MKFAYVCALCAAKYSTSTPNVAPEGVFDCEDCGVEKKATVLVVRENKREKLICPHCGREI